MYDDSCVNTTSCWVQTEMRCVPALVCVEERSAWRPRCERALTHGSCPAGLNAVSVTLLVIGLVLVLVVFVTLICKLKRDNRCVRAYAFKCLLEIRPTSRQTPPAGQESV